MNCKKCGNVLTNADQFCSNCGEPNELYNGGVSQVVPEAPVAPVVPEVPAEPASVPTEPVANPLNQAPLEPTAPVAPEAPVSPSIPETPAAPEVPVEPEAPVPMQTAANPLNQTSIAPMPSTVSQPAKPKKNVLFVVVIIVMSLVIVGLGVFIAIKLLAKPSSDPEKEIQNINNKPTEVVNTNETLTFGGLTFTIPTGLEKKTLDGETALVDSTNGYMIFLQGLTDEESLADVKTEYPAYESKYKQEVTSQGGTYIGANEYTLNGRKYFGISFYIKNVYSDVIFTEITDNYLFVGMVAYKTTSKDIAYKSLNEFLSSAKSPKAGSFAKNISKDHILSGSVTVRDEIE